jgi:hypothetical protein
MVACNGPDDWSVLSTGRHDRAHARWADGQREDREDQGICATRASRRRASCLPRARGGGGGAPPRLERSERLVDLGGHGGWSSSPIDSWSEAPSYRHPTTGGQDGSRRQQAFFAVTGHPQRELIGGHVQDLFTQLPSIDGGTTLDALDGLGALANAPIGLWTRSGELRVGTLSALVVDVDGQPGAVRDPTPVERRMAARARFTRVVEAGGPWPEVATSALQALGESLRWDFGALSMTGPDAPTLECAAVWRSTVSI